MTKMASALFIILLLQGCAFEPVIRDDHAGLGDSRLGQLLRENLHNGELIKVRNTKNFLLGLQSGDEEASKKALSDAGMSCEKVAPKCTYAGSARSRLVMPDGTTLPGNDLLFEFKIDVDTATNPFTISVAIVNKRT